MPKPPFQRPLAALLLATFAAGCASKPPSPTDAKPWSITPQEQSRWRETGTAYLGLALRENAALKATLVHTVLAGPLRPAGEQSALVSRGDILLSVDGRPMAATELRPYVRSKKPGDKITLQVRRTGGKPDSAIPTPGPESKEVTVTVTLGAREEWCGPVEFSDDAQTRPRLTVPPCDASWKEPAPLPTTAWIERRVDENALREPIEKLYSLFRSTSAELPGSNIFPAVREAFDQPRKLPEIETSLWSAFARAAGDPRLAIGWAWGVRGRPTPEGLFTPLNPPALDQPAAALADAGVALREARALLAKAAPLRETGNGEEYRRLRGRLEQAMSISTGAGGIDDEGDPRPAIAAMRASMTLDHESLHAAAWRLAAYIAHGKGPAKETPTVPIPDALRDAVTGDILAALEVDGQWLVYGGFGNNTYQMDKIAVVIDPGGDDVYTSKTDQLPQAQLIVDLAGNDQYLAEKIGPACGFLGVSLIVDDAGDDRYRGNDLACGVGFWGVGIIVDRDGEDTYTGKAWSEGAGIYGMGAIVDLGSRRDEYRAQTYSQGIGGPGGVGLILDQGGNDWYLADGPEPSAYGEKNIRFSMSQGIGFGVRGYDSGGIGLLIDLAGNDRYEAGEFSQGGGYYWGLGIVRDGAGDDVYYANRYSQGFGCHQALGVVDDGSGNDFYWATMAASQGGAWDIAMGLLIDRAGNDAYRADGISQGSGAMQAIGWLIDLGGVDRYQSTSTAAQGQGSSNSYHYARTGCGSWSLLLDAEGDRDFYSCGRSAGSTVKTGAANEKQPEEGTLHGLFISVPGKVDWGR